MQNKLNSIPDEKVPDWWLTNCLVDLDELSLRANWALVSPRAVHLSSSASAKAIFKNINSNRAMLSPCLTPTLNSMDVRQLWCTPKTMISNKIHLQQKYIQDHHRHGGDIH